MGVKAQRNKENCISWKTILKYCSEFPDGEWFTIHEFRRLYGTTRVRTQQQFSTFVSWAFLRRKRSEREPGKKFTKAFVYQITPAGRAKMEYIIKQIERDMQFYHQSQVKVEK